MAFNYSRFDKIGDSDSEEEGFSGMDFKKFKQMMPGARDDLDDGQRSDDSQAESPRAALARAAKEKEDRQDRLQTTSREPASFERVVSCLNGELLGRGDDVFELVAVARATVQSSLEAENNEALSLFLRACIAGLSRTPAPVDFARDQCPEFVVEIVGIASSGLLPAEECDEALALIIEKCSAREVYTFILEALCDGRLSWRARLRGLNVIGKCLMSMDTNKRPAFLGSCLPALLKAFTDKSWPSDSLLEKLNAIHDFASSFVEDDLDSHADDDIRSNPAKMIRHLVSPFLFKVLQRSFPVVRIDSLSFSDESAAESGTETQDASSRIRRIVVSGENSIRLSHKQESENDLKALCRLARKAAQTSAKPFLKLLEGMELGDPTGDGGGDLEVSSLCLAAYVCLIEVHQRWREMRPYVLPIGLSPVRRLNILMRSCFVLISNRAEASGAGTQCWAHSGFALFSCSVLPMLRVMAKQTPEACRSLQGPMCRWHPRRCFQALLESLSSTPEIERNVRSCLFRKVQAAMRAFDWSCRFELYLEIVRSCRVDAVVGEVVTTFKEDWWPLIRVHAEKGETLTEERAQLLQLFKFILSGDLQIADGMDTLTATLNIARIVCTKNAVGQALRPHLRKGGPGIDLEGMLMNLSQQIDYELRVLKQPVTEDSAGSRLASELMEQMGAQIGSESLQGSNLNEMKQIRIEMVADLVARVRELLADFLACS